MKIGIVCYPSLGGSGVVATELGHALAAQGDQVHFITYDIPFRLRMYEENIYFHEVEINRYDLFKYPDYALPLAVKMACVAEEYDLDLFHVHYAIPHATSAYLAKQILGKHKPAVITTLHGTDITLVGRDPGYYQIVKFSIEQSDGVTAVSENLKQQILKYFHLQKPIEMIHNFFTPLTHCMEHKECRYKFVKEGEKLLVHASNFRSVKRSEDVVRIFFEVRKRIPCKLILVGTGEGLEGVRHLVQEKQLEKEVIFLGRNQDIGPYIACADLMLLPSSQESFGLTVLEAMAYGVPAVASDVGGIPEVVLHGITGFLSKPGDIQSMSEYAAALLSDPILYKKMSEAGKKRAAEHFSISKILPRYIAFYEKTLAQISGISKS